MSLEIQSITDVFAVSPQLRVADMQAVADAGFKSVIINRPDFELGAAEPSSDEMIQAAEKAGLVVCYIPVVSGNITSENVQEFKARCTSLPTPTLAYCRSGQRCAALYQLAQQAS